jgi:plastocyanin
MAVGSLAPAVLLAVSSVTQVQIPATTPVVVEITDEGFTPATLDVGVGATVEWRHVGRLDQAIRADDGSFDSGPLLPGDSFSATFARAGTYTYRSAIEGQAELIGVVRVTEAEPEEPGPPEGPSWSGDRPEPAPAPARPETGEGDPVRGHPRPQLPVGLGGEQAVPLAAGAGGNVVTVAQAGATVTVVDSAYQPKQVEVDPGATVTWQQEGVLPHTVTADDGSFDSGEMGQGDTFAHEFSQPGTYPYYCEFHGAPGGQGMAGVVVVASAGGGGNGGGDGAPQDGAPDEGATLAQTGGDVGPLAGTMLTLLAIGIACLTVDRRRRAAEVRLERLQPARPVPGGLSLG